MINGELKYNFVFLFADSDYWQAILGNEVFNSEHSKVYLYGTDASNFKKKLFHYHWAYCLNNKFKVPLKCLWYKDMYEQKFKNDLPIVFVFMGGNNIRFADGFIKYAKKRNPCNKIVIIHGDLISKHCTGYDYEEIRKKADLITTYDIGEAKKYGIEYFQETTFSKIVPEDDNVDFEYDVYFLGAAKDRLPKIMRSYYYFKSLGLRVKFIVPGVHDDQKLKDNDIEYEYISYKENLKNVIKSKCLFEIIQKDSLDITTRAVEAIAYRRKLITDCPLDLDELFNKGQIIKFENLEEIPVGIISDDYDPNSFNPCCDLSPIKRLYFIQEKLEEKSNE